MTNVDDVITINNSIEKSSIHISVRKLVEFILRSGNLDNRKGGAVTDAMLNGSKIHRMIQKRMGSEYEAEVRMSFQQEYNNYIMVVEGRADGVITVDKEVTIDEIKSTYRDLKYIKAPAEIHMAQAKCYAFMYGVPKRLKYVRVRITYCNIDTEELKYFHEEFGMKNLQVWFEDLLLAYKKWADFIWKWKQLRQESIKQLKFPFEYRKGQKELATYVYQTIYHGKKLFVQAPTGVGKTISTVFPSIKAMGEGKGDKLFYLTAKTITRTVAEDTLSILRSSGLRFKSVTLTAKEKICFNEKTECNPDKCQYALGHFDRINDAVYDMLTSNDCFQREKIEEYAKKHQVCPFELCLDMSLFSDGIICDYNYVFDPHVYLRRFFADEKKGDYLFLIDEAHNLVDRGRQMYSAELFKEDFIALKKIVKTVSPKLEKQLEKCNKELLSLKRQCETYQVADSIVAFYLALSRLAVTMDKFLEEQDDSTVRNDVLDFYFQISHFMLMYEGIDDNYVTYTQMRSDGGFMLKLFCVNPSRRLEECMELGRSSILFSATLLPIQYYKGLLGGTLDDYEVYSSSTFDNRKQLLLIGSDVTTKYSRRSDVEYYNIASYIHEIIQNRDGNYLVFFPSHSFLKQVYGTYMDYFCNEEREECIVQSDYMNEAARENFLNRFTGNEDCDLADSIYMDIEIEDEKSLVGFCVMGGIFSEGIDLKNDNLIGAIIVGTGIPQVCDERELLKNYFDSRGENGFDYAYRYPGMNKVLQSAGRVIRTKEDIGIVALLDERFLQRFYQKMFPREWEHFEVVTKDEVSKQIERFWNEWL